MSMSARTSFGGAMCVCLMLLGAARSQEPAAPMEKRTVLGSGSYDLLPPQTEGVPASTGPSSWMTYVRPGCCGGACGGPIRSELYVRSGPTVPLASGYFGSALDTGWEIQGGGRSLFFNPAEDKAWVVDLSLGYMYNNSGRPDLTFPLQGNVANPVSTQALNRTFVSFGLGREWYLVTPLDGWGWRVGSDVGGRYGSASLDLNNPLALSSYSRLNDHLTAVYLALHSDLEYPCGCCTFVGGFRAEWDYTFLDFVEGQNSDLQSVNLLINLGIRF